MSESTSLNPSTRAGPFPVKSLLLSRLHSQLIRTDRSHITRSCKRSPRRRM